MNSSIASPDNRYRYTLWRDLENDLLGSGIMLFVGLNPSTADASADDPTIRRLKSFAIGFGFARLAVGNLFAYRTSNPAEMLQARDPIGPDNDRHLRELIGMSNVVLCGWGTDGKHRGRDREVMSMIGDKAHCLAVNLDGSPTHPLYLRSDSILKPYVKKDLK